MGPGGFRCGTFSAHPLYLLRPHRVGERLVGWLNRRVKAAPSRLSYGARTTPQRESTAFARRGLTISGEDGVQAPQAIGQRLRVTAQSNEACKDAGSEQQRAG